MARLNTGPPFFAKDAAEATRALGHQIDARKRLAFAARMQARLRGNTARALDLRYNTEPLRKD